MTMDTEKLINGLAKKAGMEAYPQVNVVYQVLARLRSDYSEETWQYEKPMMWVAGISTAAALSLAAAALIAYYVSLDPLSEISQTISWVM